MQWRSIIDSSSLAERRGRQQLTIKCFVSTNKETAEVCLEKNPKVKKRLRSSDSPGMSEVFSEVLKYVPVDIIMDFINQAYDAGELPDQWNLLDIFPIPNAGDLTSTDKYRGISLSSVSAKTFTRMILNHLRLVLDPLLTPQSSSFGER